MTSDECPHNDIVDELSLGVKVCTDCGHVIEDIVESTSFNYRNEGVYELKNPHNTLYTREKNFKKLLLRYQCLQIVRFRKGDKELLLAKKHFSINSVYECINSLVKTDMFFKRYYIHINYLYFLSSGERPQSITSYEEILISQFRHLLIGFDELVRKFGFMNNFINYNLVLYRLLQLNHLSPDKKFFRFLKTEKAREKHKSKLKLIINYDPPTFL